MKTIILFLLIFSIKLNAQDTIKHIFNFTGKTTHYAVIDKDYIPHIVDTVVNQERIIHIAKDNSMFEVGFEIDSVMIYIEYYIDKVYTSTNHNITLNSSNNHYTNYLAFDEDGYPMLLMLSFEQDHCYLYYYWNDTERSFKKSEKIVLTSVDTE
jgi:hypothetical protein